MAVATSIQCQQNVYTLRNLCWSDVNFLSATMGAWLDEMTLEQTTWNREKWWIQNCYLSGREGLSLHRDLSALCLQAFLLHRKVLCHLKKPIPCYVCCENKCVHCKHKCINWQQYDGSHICQMGWCIRRVFLQDVCCCLAFDKTWAIFMFKSLQCIIAINLAGVQLSNIRKPLKLSDFARWPYWIRKRNNN